MSNLLNLTKINFCGQFRISKFSSILSLLKTLLFISLYCILGFFIYRFANYMVTTFNTLGMPELALSEFFTFSNMFILALSIFRMDIFNSKDHDFLVSLPISKKVIVASKLINVYIFNLLIIAIIMVPVYIAYINTASYSPNFFLLAIISILIIPIIPTTIAVFLNSIITIISTHFKYKKIIQTILMLILMIFSLYFAYEMNNSLELDILNISGSFNNFFNTFYPPTKYFINMLVDNNINSMLIFIGISNPSNPTGFSSFVSFVSSFSIYLTCISFPISFDIIPINSFLFSCNSITDFANPVIFLGNSTSTRFSFTCLALVPNS